MKKRDLLDGLKELYQANEEYAKINIAVSADAQEGLVQCQETAITLGNELEGRGGCGERLMHMLEGYCESVYQLSLNLANEDIRGELVNKIRQQLLQVQDGIINGLPADKKEVAFFPYKASMWDSLESVWMAAKEDEECDTYVVPIPYFDKNPDGTIREWHYEGNEYPGYVPVTPWEEYDPAERQPDIAFIHNPYDGANYVTSVHPAFYSSELKKCTDMLVYIPYFIAMNHIGKHLCTPPAVFYADRVIVQPGEIRDTYVQAFVEAAGEKQQGKEGRAGRADKQYWERLTRLAEEKFLPLGSPKVDRVLRICREDVEIPEQWERLITRPDGTRKKVILYNTVVDALLQCEDRGLYLRKLEAVLGTFRRHGEVTLLWRPHPLLQSTLDSMAPQVAAQYRRIVERYRGGGWGIYDDTADLDRAIAISDAYYGDKSSVAALYRETGKPVMLQDVTAE